MESIRDLAESAKVAVRNHPSEESLTALRNAALGLTQSLKKTVLAVATVE